MTQSEAPNPSVTVRGDLSEADVRRVAALYALPGETVRLNTRIRGATPVSDHSTLTVRETVASGTPDEPHVHYSFVEIEGDFVAGRFMSALPFESVYGALIEVDGTYWLVPLSSTVTGKDGVKPPVTVTDEPRPILRELTRASRECFGMTDDAFFAHVSSNPGTGEFVLVDLDDGRWKLDWSPWWTGTDGQELKVAREAVAAHALADPTTYFRGR